MKKILLLGLGISNIAVLNYLKDEYEVYIYDDYKKDKDYYTLKRLKKEMPLFDLVIRSPGIPYKSEVYKFVTLLTKEIISEIEFAIRILKDRNAKYIVVTGTNGKTTICNQLYQVLSIKHNVFLAGNIGVPLISLVNRIKDNDIVIIEMSSFQIENTYSNFADFIIVTNISKNHLDEVYSYDYYKASKKRVVSLLKSDGHLIVDKRLNELFISYNPLLTGYESK